MSVQPYSHPQWERGPIEKLLFYHYYYYLCAVSFTPKTEHWTLNTMMTNGNGIYIIKKRWKMKGINYDTNLNEKRRIEEIFKDLLDFDLKCRSRFEFAHINQKDFFFFFDLCMKEMNKRYAIDFLIAVIDIMNWWWIPLL